MSNQISDVTICATALLELGLRPINDFGEDNEAARLCSSLYPTVRDEALREHTWNFAKKRAKVGPDRDKPAFGYANQFTLPGDYIRLISVNDAPFVSGVGLPPGYSLESGKILSDHKILDVRYVYANYEPLTWDASFVRLVICAMKRYLAFPLLRSDAAAQREAQSWAIALKQAKTINGVEIPPQEIAGETFLASRY